ncbi:MAG: hypothetical protein C4536_15240 [Actinobacteria bacterium]|nr:MAG: hypothetical protein C4536_15240 [Actinomycetota bacterium]
MRYNAMLKTLALPFKAYPPGEAPVKSPDVFRSFHGLEEVPLAWLWDAALAYIGVFGEPPWNETWEAQEVVAKMESELKRPACLTLMEGDAEQRVGGFCWGAVVPVEEAADRAVEAHRFKGSGVRGRIAGKLEAVIKGKRAFFLDEVAISRRFRGGMAPIQFLVRPALEIAVDEGTIEGVGWTSWNSKIAPLSLYLGFSTLIAEVEEIAFLYNPDIRPLLKIAQNVNGQVLERIIRSASRLVRKVA